MKLQGILQAFHHPVRERGALWRFVRGQVVARLSTPDIPVQSRDLKAEARELGKRVRDFGLAVQGVLRQYREAILERQYVQERIADAACDLYASSCTLSRLDHLLTQGNHSPAEVKRDVAAGRYFLTLSNRRIRQNLAALADNDDGQTTAAADAALERS
jgi:hypothetical protein